MKKMKKLIVAAALMCSAMLMAACGDNASGEKEYKVAVKDALGTPYTEGVVVQFYQDGVQTAMQVVDAQGVATKTLAAGDYTVKLQFTDGEEGYYYVEEGLTLSATDTELDVILANAVTGDGRVLTVGENSYDAYDVKTGCTHVELEAGERTYFLFTPTEAGTYEFSVVDGADVTIGYYGAPHFVQGNNVADMEDGKFTISVSASMIGAGDTGTTVLVIGVDSTNAKECVLAVERIGDPEWSLADEPWVIYEKTVELSQYVLPAGTTLSDFDIFASTDTYNLVYNEADGFYHMNTADGPLCYVRLTVDSKYLACFKSILERSGVSKYFYDADGNFEKKVSYSECLLEYIDCADETEGVYPLTEDLKYIIQQRGEFVGWFDAESSQYLFVDADGNPISGVNDEISWLFMCCYAN